MTLADGKRIVVAPPTKTRSEPRDTVVFVFNFFEELRRRAPRKGP